MPYSIVSRKPSKPLIAEEAFQTIMKRIRIETADWKSWDGEWALMHTFGTIERIEVHLTCGNTESVTYHMDRYGGEYYDFSCVNGNDLFSGFGLTHAQRIEIWEKIMEHPRFRLLWICGEI